MYETALHRLLDDIPADSQALMHSSFDDLKIAGLFGPKASILDTIGRTPTVRLNNIGPNDVSVFAKLEAFNPLGSVKDRLAVSVIEDAERSGALKPGQTVIEATSGNTGIGLAMVCAQKRYPLVIVMAENFSVERRRLIRFLGAKVILTPASEKGTGMLAKARELAQAHEWFFADQFANPANSAVHARTTAIEILADFDKIGLDYWVTGFGTGGTLHGVGKTLRRYSPATRIIAVEPDNAPMLASGQGNDGPGGQSHSGFRPHPMQGWSPDFLSPIALEARDHNMIDQFVGVSGDNALQTARDLAAREGILAGITGGATVAAALEIAKTVPAGSNILAMVPDTGERYQSTPLFAEIQADMNDEELEIARSTAGYRFDVTKMQAPAHLKPQAAPASADSTIFVENIIQNTRTPVVMFALEWCEFCWSVRNLFDAVGIPFTSINLDAANFEGGQAFAAEVRKALHHRTFAATIPQIFVNGIHIGGATETFDAFNAGALQTDLCDIGIDIEAGKVDDAYRFLPDWLHSMSD